MIIYFLLKVNVVQIQCFSVTFYLKKCFIFQSGMTHHVMIGVQLLSQVVCEMNQVDTSNRTVNVNSFVKNEVSTSKFTK